MKACYSTIAFPVSECTFPFHSVIKLLQFIDEDDYTEITEYTNTNSGERYLDI